jgi:multiple sugar transport system ATP-binding protein
MPAVLSADNANAAIGQALVRDVDVFCLTNPTIWIKLRTDLRVELKRLHQKLKYYDHHVTHDQVET